MNADSLIDDVARLLHTLRERQIDYVLVGGIAMLQYVAGRNTEDIDLIMAFTSLQILPEIEVQSQDANFVRARYDELQVDILLTRNRLFDRVRRKHVTTRPFAEQDVPCATVEGLLLLKLFALPSLYRQGDFARVSLYENDIAMLIQAYRPDIETLLGELAPHMVDSDRIAVREVLEDIQRRIARFDTRNENL